MEMILVSIQVVLCLLIELVLVPGFLIRLMNVFSCTVQKIFLYPFDHPSVPKCWLLGNSQHMYMCLFVCRKWLKI